MIKMKYGKNDFVEKANAVHGFKYGYDKVVYVNSRVKVIITCSLHGEFTQRPNNHINGTGCPICSGRIPKRQDMSFIRMNDGSRVIPLTHGSFSLVDDEDYQLVSKYNWCLNKWGYARNGSLGLMHRYILNVPNDKYLDHINGNRLDNRRSNLRICTKQQNSYNSKSRGGSSIYKGVCWDKRYKKWIARSIKEGVVYNIGRFDNEIEAALAVDEVSRELQGEFAYLNFK